jgi:hypothetical protein
MYRYGPGCPQGPAFRITSVGGGPVATDRREQPIRQGLVFRIRREIAAGSYDTPEKLEYALGRLLEQLDLD